MLTERNLVVMRAALKYWIDEMSPHGYSTFPPYIAESERALGVSVNDAESALRFLDRCQLYCVMIDEGSLRIQSNDLMAASTQTELAYQSDQSRIATVLLPRSQSD